MADLYLNTQNIILNLQHNLHLSGVHSIINKKSNVIICTNNISGSIIADSSNIIIDNITNISSRHLNVIFSTNNSKITQLNKLIAVNNNNGSIYNFNNPSGTISTGGINSVDLLANQSWNPHLVNDGNKFIWYNTNKLNDYKLVNNSGLTITIPRIAIPRILESSTLADFNLLIKNIPKNLYGKTLIINCPAEVIKGTKLIVSGFYNGTVKIYADELSERVLWCIDIEHLLITSSSSNIQKYIKLLNIELCTINNLIFSGGTDKSGPKNTIDNISEIYNYNYAILKKHAEDNFKLYIINSNVVLSNCNFTTCDQTIVYCTLNSKLTAYCNTFNYSINNDFQRRPICYYISRNSTCTAYKDTIKIWYNITNGLISLNIDNDDNRLIFNTLLLNNSINNQIEKYKGVLESDDNDKKTFIYGFAYPGSIFNHEHKSKLLKRKDVKNADLIGRKLLPLGSIYLIPNKIANKVLNGSNLYAASSTIGYHVFNSPSTYVGISYNLPIPGYFTYKIYKLNANQTEKEFNKTVDALERLMSKLNLIHLFSNNIVFPLPSLQRRYKGKYSENVKYSQIMRHHFYLSACPYFNISLLNSFFGNYEERPLLASIPSALYGAIPSSDFNNVKTAIQYNLFINYDKTIFNTNIEDE